MDIIATSYKTKLGDLTISSRNNKLVAIDHFKSEKSQTNRYNDSIIFQIYEYLNGNRKKFDIEIDLSDIKGFKNKALMELFKIPFGQTISYKDLGNKAGIENAARAVGNTMATNPIPIVVPCHRVLKSDGSIGGFSWGLDIKRILLNLEGIRVK